MPFLFLRGVSVRVRQQNVRKCPLYKCLLHKNNTDLLFLATGYCKLGSSLFKCLQGWMVCQWQRYTKIQIFLSREFFVKFELKDLSRVGLWTQESLDFNSPFITNQLCFLDTLLNFDFLYQRVMVVVIKTSCECKTFCKFLGTWKMLYKW